MVYIHVNQKLKRMDKLKKFINNNIETFSNLDNSEVQEIELSDIEITSDMVDYLKSAKHNRFDYNGICVYYVKKSNNIWVENMDS
jgi:hypothetical protein